MSAKRSLFGSQLPTIGDSLAYLQPRVSRLLCLCLLFGLMLGPASATDVAFIVADVSLANAGDALVNDILLERGFNVTLVSQNDDADTTLAAANAADLTIISESVGSGNVNTEVKDSTSPVLLYEAYLYDDFQWMPGDSISNDFNPSDNGGNTTADLTNSITIVEPGHPLAAGFPAGDVDVYTETGVLSYGRLTAASANIVATVPGFPETATIFAFEPGDVGLDGVPIPARRVGFFAGGLLLSGSEFSESGRALFDAALNYSLGFTDVTQGDFNGDGVVDIADFNIMAANFNAPGTFAQGDNNFSGTVDLADFLAVRKIFNAPAGAAPVPEPSGMTLCIMAAIMSVCLGRRRLH